MDVSLSLNMTILPSLCTSCTQATSTHFFRRVLCVILTKSDLAEAKSDLGRIQYFLGSFTTYLFPTSLRLRRTGGFRMTWGGVFGFTMMNSARLMNANETGADLITLVSSSFFSGIVQGVSLLNWPEYISVCVETATEVLERFFRPGYLMGQYPFHFQDAEHRYKGIDLGKIQYSFVRKFMQKWLLVNELLGIRTHSNTKKTSMCTGYVFRDNPIWDCP